ncbi:MAG: excinuclease ABC subunit C [Polaribacter sp.]|jgi:excinuclease ABC subunit C
MPEFDVKNFLSTLTLRPGIYKMLNQTDEIIYIGKAKNLKNRVSSYFQKTDHVAKTKVMVAQIARVEVMVTASENDALVLEQQLIKKHRPRYNVIFRDDKSYPYILLSDEEYPRLSIHRGKQSKKGEYFGPFTGSTAARYSITLMQKLFAIRQCENSTFNYRSRPCLQYQIKRCSGSCVNKISKQDYLKDVELVRLFYRGKNDSVVNALNQRMEQASESLEFELAARYRDQMIHLRRVLEKQSVHHLNQNKMLAIDVLSVKMVEKVAVVFLLQIRNGMVQGSKQFFPKVPPQTSQNEVLKSFLEHYYSQNENEIPHELICEHLNDLETEVKNEIENILCHLAERQVKTLTQVKTNKLAWLNMARNNAILLLKSKIEAKTHTQKRLQLLMEELSLDRLPIRMECFDISHFQGEETVASCVVFEHGIAKKSDYRRFNINDVAKGDDYAAIEQAVRRRFKRLVKEDARLPDLLLIDGGKGQLNQAQKVLEDLEISDVTLVSVAKGSDRKVGMEQIYFPSEAIAKRLDEDSPALHLIQAIRDEAHRFAITGHRGKRDKKRRTSTLEGIAGVGAKRRKAIIQHFGGLQEVTRAGINDLMKVDGINKSLAISIYDYLH